MRTTLAVALALALPACDGSSSPNNPTPTPATPTWTLSGSVISLENVDIAINGATVTVLDGPSANRSAMTDADGRFTLANLQQGGFTVRVSANGYQSVSRGITLTRNTFMDFGLRPDPRAILIVEGSLAYDPLPDGSVNIRATGVNTGKGCAWNVSGLSTLTGTSGFTLTLSWELNRATIIRPGERFQYVLGPVSQADIARFGSSGTYSTSVSFSSLPCP